MKWKRIESQKKELATHNSFEKGLKESILQLSTPESLTLYHTLVLRPQIHPLVLRWNHFFGIQIAHGSFAKMTESLAIPDQNFQKGIP